MGHTIQNENQPVFLTANSGPESPATGRQAKGLISEVSQACSIACMGNILTGAIPFTPIDPFYWSHGETLLRVLQSLERSNRGEL